MYKTEYDLKAIMYPVHDTQSQIIGRTLIFSNVFAMER